MNPRSSQAPVDCRRCRHFRTAPYQARVSGCYLQKNMESKQDAAYLDQQQIPGNHEKINLRGDCPDFEALPPKVPWWERLWSVGA